MDDDFKRYCKKEKRPKSLKRAIIDDLAEAYPEDISSKFCATICPCKANILNFPTYAPYATMITNPNGASKITDCMDNPIKTVKSSIIDLLKWAEEEFDCSGFCITESWYFHSDVNRGVPSQRCWDEMENYFTKWLTSLYLLLPLHIIISAGFCLNLIYFRRSIKHVWPE